jgi:Zn-dependent protease with chaperone function
MKQEKYSISMSVYNKEISGWLFEKRSARKQNAILCLKEGGILSVKVGEQEKSCNTRMVEFSDRIGNMQRTITLPDGSLFESPDNESIDELLSTMSLKRKASLLHMLESKKKAFALVLLIFFFCIYAAKTFVIPFASKKAAFAVPDPVLVQISVKVITLIDENYVSTSTLPNDKKKVFRAHFKKLLPAGQKGQLLFRKGNAIGANAFALPDGTVIITDELILMSKHDHEIAAVLAHEIGHAVHRHGMQQVIRGSILSIISVAIFGDVVSISTVLSTLPAIIMQNAYSRDFEREADAFARSEFEKRNMDIHHFITMLRRLEKHSPENSKFNLFSTHPPISERVELIKSKAD